FRRGERRCQTAWQRSFVNLEVIVPIVQHSSLSVSPRGLAAEFHRFVSTPLALPRQPFGKARLGRKIHPVLRIQTAAHALQQGLAARTGKAPLPRNPTPIGRFFPRLPGQPLCCVARLNDRFSGSMVLDRSFWIAVGVTSYVALAGLQGS